MKIAIVTPFYKPSIGGVEYIAYHTARELSKKGFKVHVITTTYDNRWKRIASPGTSVEDEVHIHRLENSPLMVGYATFMKGLKETIRGIAPDVVHCHNLHPHLFQSMKWKDELKYGLVAQLHFPVATGIDHLSAKIFFPLVMRDLVRNQHRINALIAHTNTERQWLIEEGIETDRIRIVRFPGIPDELLEYKPKSDIHEKLSVGTVITYISRIHPRKGQHLLIEAANYLKNCLKDFRVYIAGPPSDSKYLKDLYQLVDKLDLSKTVVIDPRSLSEEEKLDSITSSDVFACTTLRDLHPIVILEALALKTPVVATDVGAIPEMLSPNTIIEESLEAAGSSLAQGLKDIAVITKTDPKLISEVLIQLLSRKGSRYSEAFNDAIKPYLISRITEELIRIYKDLQP